jgi:hypothetical protein
MSHNKEPGQHFAGETKECRSLSVVVRRQSI